MAGLLEELVTLVVDGKELRGWQEVNITRSMEDAAIAFAMKATNPAWSREAKALRHGKEVEIFTGRDLLCRGYVDAYESDIGEGDHREVRISGRSKSQDCIDCPPAKHKTGRIENKTLEEVANELDEFGVGFSSDVKLDKLKKVQVIPGETVFQTLEREARKLGLLLEGQPDGSVKITRGQGRKRHAGALVEGRGPATKWLISLALADKRSDVIVKGQRAVGIGKDNLRQEATEYDPNVGRYRPIILFNEGDDTEKEIRRRAEWERLRRSGSGVTVSPQVSRWRDEAGTLWTPGHLMAVQVPSEELDMDLMLKSVTYSQTLTEGTRATLTLVDPRTMGAKKAATVKQDKAFDPGEEWRNE